MMNVYEALSMDIVIDAYYHGISNFKFKPYISIRSKCHVIEYYRLITVRRWQHD